MMMRIALATVAMMAASMSGCGESGPKLVPVKGTVMFEGKPLEEAAISFLPSDPGSESRPGEAITDQQGTYKALTMGRTGLTPGRYKVIVTKSLVNPEKATGEQFQDDPFMAQLTMTPPEGGPRKKKSKPDRIDAQFERDVPLEGTDINLDVTPKT